MKKLTLLIPILLFANANDNFYYQNDKKVFLTPIVSSQKFRKINSIDINYYTTPNYNIVGVTKEFIIKLKDEKSLEILLKKYPITLKKRLASNLYLMEVNTIDKTIDMTQKLYLDTNVIYVHPNFIKKIKLR